jgi:hypothetical protein
MFFGGRSYPDADADGDADADEFDCAATGTDIAQIMTAAKKTRFKTF